MGPSRSVSEIDGDITRNSQNFLTPLYFASPLTGFPLELVPALEVIKLQLCHVGYLFANFRLPRPLCSRVRPDVCDRQTSDAHHRLLPLP